MGRVWDGKKKTETLVSSMREDVGVLHSKGLLKDNTLSKRHCFVILWC